LLVTWQAKNGEFCSPRGELGLVEEKWVREYSRGGRREKKEGGTCNWFWGWFT